MEGKGTYIYKESDYNVIIEYQLYWDEGNYDVSPESELTIASVTLDAFEEGSQVNMTGLFNDHMEESWIYQGLWNYAWENKND
tara:strand:- start:549 stop:797 length:249 start_codon:yes stop_codon:yes gene_type:complete